MSPKMRPTTQTEWREALAALPSTPDKIPSFYFAHGQPMLLWPDSLGPPRFGGDIQGPKGPLSRFLSDFGPALLSKYKPKGIVVFSAHWETADETLVTDYGSDQPLLYDYYGFDPELYQLKFSSSGDTVLSDAVVESLRKAKINARTTKVSEPRGEDGRGFAGPGLDHGTFIPLILMLGHDFHDVPIVQVSIDSSLDPNKEWALGKALESLRSEGILILAGGLPVHTFRDFTAFSEKTAKQPFKDFCTAIYDAAEVESPSGRREALIGLTKHYAFRLSNPREEHLAPIWVAGGAGEAGEARIIAALYGAPTIAFGV